MDFSSVNFLAVLVAALSSFILGGLWYSPLLFGKPWMQATGVTQERAQASNKAKTFGLAFLASLVIAFNLALFLGSDSTLQTGAFYGFLAGFGWVAMAFAINDLFELRPFNLLAINAGYHTVAFTVMGAIVGSWH